MSAGRLNGIVGLTELVLASSECTEDSRRRLDVVKSQAMRLNSLVDDILDAASNKRGHLIVKNGRCDLREISENVCMMVQPLVSSKVQLINNMSVGGDAIIDGDSNRISQILTNLLGNAIKFTKSGSITIRNRTGRDLVVVEVVDTGIGIADEKLEKIWDAFESEDELADSKYASSGLGLSLVSFHSSDLAPRLLHPSCLALPLLLPLRQSAVCLWYSSPRFCILTVFPRR